MKDLILKQLKKLNQQEKEELFFDFLSSKNHDLIQIENTLFKLEEIDIIKAFIELGMDANIINRVGITPLFYVQSKETAEILIVHGADVNAKSIQGSTPLFYVKSKEMAEVLIQAGADVNIKNKIKNTPLFFAVIKEIAEVLIQSHADLDNKNNRDETPAEYQRDSFHNDIADLIEQKKLEQEIQLEKEKLNQTILDTKKIPNRSRKHL